MTTNRADLKMFVNKFCYDQLFKAVGQVISSRPTVLNSKYTSVGHPDTATLLSLLIESVQNVAVSDDVISFDLIVSCEVLLETENVRMIIVSKEIKGWLRISCTAAVTDHLKSFEVKSVVAYARDVYTKSNGVESSATLVPVIHREQYEEEAEAFLARYCPEALRTPMAVPIRKIMEEQMGLTVETQYALSKDLSYLGEICFSKGTVETWDVFQMFQENHVVQRGTVLIDPYTFLQYNMGCFNNTLAHEAFHWHRHRVYASIRILLSDTPVISHRCPIKEPGTQESLTDEQWMEIQANSIAPRILMPREMFKRKTDELFHQYNYEESPLKLAILKCIAHELSSFFSVSYSSVMIRLIEVGYNDFYALKQAEQDTEKISFLDIDQAYYAYETSEEVRKLVDAGLFVWADGYYVINDPGYVTRSADGNIHLTGEAWNDLEKCTLCFSKKTIIISPDSIGSGRLFHRAGNTSKKVPEYSSVDNANVISLSEDLKKLQELFVEQETGYGLYRRGMSCCQYINAILESRGLTKNEFLDATLLTEKTYTRIRNNYSPKPDKATIMAVACGLNLDISTTEELMRLAGYTFSDAAEDRALRFCVTALTGKSIFEKNDFLIACGVKPLGSRTYQ